MLALVTDALLLITQHFKSVLVHSKKLNFIFIFLYSLMLKEWSDGMYGQPRKKVHYHIQLIIE